MTFTTLIGHQGVNDPDVKMAETLDGVLDESRNVFKTKQEVIDYSFTVLYQVSVCVVT